MEATLAQLVANNTSMVNIANALQAQGLAQTRATDQVAQALEKLAASGKPEYGRSPWSSKEVLDSANMHMVGKSAGWGGRIQGLGSDAQGCDPNKVRYVGEAHGMAVEG